MKNIKQIIIWSILAGLILATSWSLARPGLFRVHDYIHAARIAEMTTALQAGHFPVRWSANFGFGYGMPLFQFYAPLPFYVGSLVYWLGFGPILSVKSLFFISNIGTIIGGYLLGKRLFGRGGGIVVAASLGLAPYRAVNLFVRGAVSEAWGIMFLPWIVWAIIGVFNSATAESSSQSKLRWQWVWLIGSLTGLLLSHNLTTLLFVPVSIFMGAVYGCWKFRANLASLLKPVMQLAASYAAAIGLAAFYVFPALLENKFTKIDSILGGYFHYSQHFLYLRQFWLPSWGFGGSEWGPNDGISFFFGFGQWLGLMTVGVLLARMIWKNRSPSKLVSLFTRKEFVLASLFGVIFVGSVFMSLLKSKAIWDAVSVLHFIQFPWRWLSVSILAIALLNGLSASLLQNSLKRMLVLSVLLALLLPNAWYFRPEKMLADPYELYYTDPARIQAEMSGILPDYIPVQMPDELTPPNSQVWLEPDQTLPPEVSILVDRGHELLLATNFSEVETIHVAIANYPGWQVELNGTPSPDSLSESTTGNIQVTVPAGQHRVGIFWGQTPVRLWSDLVSGVTVVLVLGVVVLTSADHYRKAES